MLRWKARDRKQNMREMVIIISLKLTSAIFLQKQIPIKNNIQSIYGMIIHSPCSRVNQMWNSIFFCKLNKYWLKCNAWDCMASQTNLNYAVILLAALSEFWCTYLQLSVLNTELFMQAIHNTFLHIAMGVLIATVKSICYMLNVS